MWEASNVPMPAGTAAPATLASRTKVSMTSADVTSIGSPITTKTSHTSNAFSE